MSNDGDRTMSDEEPEAGQAHAEVPQSESGIESEEMDLLLEQRSTPELRRWLRDRYRVVTGG
jgi:hypothetical protein